MVAAGSKGIGFAAAAALVEEGCSVSICGRSTDALEQAISKLGPRAKSYVCDVSNPADVEEWFGDTQREMGQADILVTNTGGPPAGGVLNLTDEQWESGVQSTLMNVVRMVRHAAPGMRERNWGRIVHITSLYAKEPSRLLPLSSTLRCGLMSLTKLQAWELAPSGVTVNGVLPGHTFTDRQLHLVQVRSQQEGIDIEEATKRQAEACAMKRFADPKEIGAVIAFLCSQQAAYVSGTSLLVDGATSCAVG